MEKRNLSRKKKKRGKQVNMYLEQIFKDTVYAI
jgi:hypothetical protein